MKTVQHVGLSPLLPQWKRRWVSREERDMRACHRHPAGQSGSTRSGLSAPLLPTYLPGKSFLTHHMPGPVRLPFLPQTDLASLLLPTPVPSTCLHHRNITVLVVGVPSQPRKHSLSPQMLTKCLLYPDPMPGVGSPTMDKVGF